MMSIFASPFCAPQTSTEPSLVPLFRLLDGFDQYSRDVKAAQPQTKLKPRQKVPAPLPRFNPRFDVRETEDTYELHGELPGIERENLNIEFTDPRTIQIRGRVERTKEEQPAEPASENEQQTGAPEVKTASSSHRATVEDDPEETSSNASWTPVGSPKPETVVAKKAAAAEVEKAPPVANNTTSKIWLWERSIGEFSRTFTFPTDVEHENVTAGLNNGVLTLTVPKQKMITPRRIAIY